MDRTRAVSDDTPQAASPPNVPSKSTNTPPSMTKSADSESRRPASGPTPQKRLSYAEMAKKGLSNERLNGAAGANPAVAPGQSSRRVTRPTGNPPATAVSGATSRSRQPIAERRDTNQFDNELGQRSRGGRQPSSDTDDTQNAPVHPTSSSKPSDISASKQARTAQRDGVTNSAPVLSASSMRVRRSPSFRDASHSRASQETGSNIPPVPPRTEEMREKYGIPIPEVDLPRERTTVRPRAEPDNRTTSVHPSVQPSTPSPSSSTPHERNATRSKAEQVRRTASTQPPFKLSTPPPPPLKRPSASASPSSTAPVSTKMSSSRMHTSRGTLLYESHHASATTESLQRGHKDPSAIRHGPYVPLKPTPALNDSLRQGHEDSSDIPHSPPVPPKVDSATTVPPRQDSQDLSATPPSPNAPLQQGHVGVSATSYRPDAQHGDRNAVLQPSRSESPGNSRPLSCWTRFTRWCARCWTRFTSWCARCWTRFTSWCARCWTRFTSWCARCCSCCNGSPVSLLSPEHVMEGLDANTR